VSLAFRAKVGLLISDPALAPTIPEIGQVACVCARQYLIEAFDAGNANQRIPDDQVLAMATVDERCVGNLAAQVFAQVMRLSISAQSRR
jgi:hypothetical protein